jgi:hypothetical protein
MERIVTFPPFFKPKNHFSFSQKINDLLLDRWNPPDRPSMTTFLSDHQFIIGSFCLGIYLKKGFELTIFSFRGFIIPDTQALLLIGK